MTDKKLLRIDGATLPNGWKVATLADVTEYIQRGKGPKYVEHSDLPVINQKCIRWFGIQKEHLKFVDPEQWRAWAAERYVRAGDVLWNSTGTGTIGRAALVKHLAPGEKYVVDSHVTIVRPKDIEPQYIHYWIMSPPVQGSIEAMQSGSTNQVELSKAAVEALPIPVAPRDQQKRIVAEIEKQFSRLDEAVANLKRVKANLKRYKAAVLKAAVEGRLVETEAERARREGRSYETGAQLLQRILETRRSQWQGKGKYKEPAAPDTTGLPELPEGWVWASVDQLGYVGTGATPLRSKRDYYEGGKTPWVTSGALNEEFITAADECITDLAVDETNAKVFPVHTLLVAMYGEGKTRGKVSELMIAAATNQACAAIVMAGLAAKVRNYVKLFFLKNYEDIRRLSSGGVQPNLNLSHIKGTAIPLPPVAEQYRIVAEVDRCFTRVNVVALQVDANLARVKALRNSVLGKAFMHRSVGG